MRSEVLVLAVLALAGCKAAPPREAEAKQAAPTLVGTWRTETPVRYYGEDLRTDGEGQTDYGADGRFRYAGRLVIHGEKVPAEGLAFHVEGAGTWRLDGRLLTEDFTTVAAKPEGNTRGLNPLAARIGKDMADQPPSISIIDLRADRLTLRDRDSGVEATYLRVR